MLQWCSRVLWFVADPGDVSVAVRSQAAAARYKLRSCPGAETARAAHPVDGEEHAVNLLCYIKKGHLQTWQKLRLTDLEQPCLSYL